MEEWKVYSKCDKYLISTSGRIKSLYTNRILKLVLGSNGYYQVCLRINKKSHNRSVHRLIAEMFIPNLENKRTVNHKDGNKLNNNVNNLEWNTDSENTIHAINNNLRFSKKGLEHHNVKLTENDVINIFKSRLSESKLSKIYNVSGSQIGKIKRKDRWKHILKDL